MKSRPVISRPPEYRLTVTIRNNLLLRRIEATRGFVSVRRFCDKHGLTYSDVCGLVTTHDSPLTKAGEWRDLVERLASILRTIPAELFPERVLRGRIAARKVVREVGEDELLALSDPEALALIEHRTPSPEQQVETRDLLVKLLVVLPERQRRVVEAYYGLGGTGEAPHTLETLAAEWGISSTRIHQILRRAMYRMRSTAFRQHHLMSAERFHALVHDEALPPGGVVGLLPE